DLVANVAFARCAYKAVVIRTHGLTDTINAASVGDDPRPDFSRPGRSDTRRGIVVGNICKTAHRLRVWYGLIDAIEPIIAGSIASNDENKISCCRVGFVDPNSVGTISIAVIPVDCGFKQNTTGNIRN